LKKFIDFDRRKEVIFDNLYLDDQKIVVKMPLLDKGKNNKFFKRDVKIEKFNLSKYTFLLNY